MEEEVLFLSYLRNLSENKENSLFLSYLKLQNSNAISLMKSGIFEGELFKQFKAEEFKATREEDLIKIDKELLDKIEFNSEEDAIPYLIDSKGFLVSRNSPIINVSPELDIILKRLIYKKVCLHNAISMDKALDFDLFDLIISINSLKELKNEDGIDNRIFTEKEIYKKIMGGRYIDFHRAIPEEYLTNIFLKLMESDCEEILNLNTYKEAAVISPNLIKVENLGEIFLEKALPDTSIKYKVYLNELKVKCYPDKPLEYSFNIHLVFLEDQNKLFNK